MQCDSQTTAIGRLMEVLSWYGKSIRLLRGHGQGIEDVLTTEVIQALDLLPRSYFLARVLEECAGPAGNARTMLVDAAEALRVEAHADRYYLNPSQKTHQAAVAVDPDAVLESTEVIAFVEAKRIAKGAAFQPEQLARQYFVLTREARGRAACLLLLLGTEPPVKVRGTPGRVDPVEAIRETLPAVYHESEQHPLTLEALLDEVEGHLLWTTWEMVEGVVASAIKDFSSRSKSVDASVARVARPILGCVERHRR